MANPQHLKILKQGVEAWNKWRCENPKIKPDLGKANLRRASLGKANLSNANLNKAYLIDAYLNKANLSGANLSGADLLWSKLAGANLSGANLSKAYLCATNLTGADLSGANLTGTSLAPGNPILKSADFNNADLRNVTFTPEGEPIGKGSFLGLATCDGLESAKFSSTDFLQDYLTRAFEYAHKPDIPEAKIEPRFVEEVIKKIRYLQSLYTDQHPPKHLIKVVGVITTELIKYLKKHPKAMYKIKPRQFEELVAEILTSYGWDITITPAIKDGGYDIFGITKGIKPGMESSWIIECKKYAPENRVGVDIVRSLYGVKTKLRVANALLATTSYFTKGAKDFKASCYDVDLKDYHSMLEWINEYRPNPNGKLYIKDNRLIVPGKD